METSKISKKIGIVIELAVDLTVINGKFDNLMDILKGSDIDARIVFDIAKACGDISTHIENSRKKIDHIICNVDKND